MSGLIRPGTSSVREDLGVVSSEGVLEEEEEEEDGSRGAVEASKRRTSWELMASVLVSERAGRSKV